MKRIALILAGLMIFAVFAGCSTNSQQGGAAEGEEASGTDMHYAFEFTDINGKVHKLSDYEGKPVFLEIWGSWCGVCTASLEAMNEFAGEEHDYYVLSVVFPNHSGEKSEEDFIEWYNEFEYENLIVMFDNDLQIVKDFGISGFPSNVFFDSHGNFAGGQVGQMAHDAIDAVMADIAQKDADGN